MLLALFAVQVWKYKFGSEVIWVLSWDFPATSVPCELSAGYIIAKFSAYTYVVHEMIIGKFQLIAANVT